LIAIDRGDRRVLALCKIAQLDELPVVVPAAVVGQVWRDGARQTRIARLLNARGTVVEPLDLDVAKRGGLICGRAGSRDVVDATVVLAARQHGAKIVTSDRTDIQRLDAAVSIIPC
jgi:hypothetical protein